MDKFMVDLDSVLDELEAEENKQFCDSSLTPISDHLSAAISLSDDLNHSSAQSSTNLNHCMNALTRHRESDEKCLIVENPTTQSTHHLQPVIHDPEAVDAVTCNKNQSLLSLLDQDSIESGKEDICDNLDEAHVNETVADSGTIELPEKPIDECNLNCDNLTETEMETGLIENFAIEQPTSQKEPQMTIADQCEPTAASDCDKRVFSDSNLQGHKTDRPSEKIANQLENYDFDQLLEEVRSRSPRPAFADELDHNQFSASELRTQRPNSLPVIPDEPEAEAEKTVSDETAIIAPIVELESRSHQRSSRAPMNLPVIQDEEETTENEEKSQNEANSESTREVNIERNETTEEEEEEWRVGYKRPLWVPDESTEECLLCGVKFNLIRRRHHCRACGMVLCGQCCSEKARLPYLDNKEARVCVICLPHLGENSESVGQPHPLHLQTTSSSRHHSSSFSSATASELGAAAAAACPTPVSVLRRTSSFSGEGTVDQNREPKQVIFSDGIRPGDDLTENFPSQMSSSAFRQRVRAASGKKIKSPPIERHSGLTSQSPRKSRRMRITVSDGIGQLPAVINTPQLMNEPTYDNLMRILCDDESSPVVFSLAKNLSAKVKCVKKSCCLGGKEVWVFSSFGLNVAGQDEMMVVLEREKGEIDMPRDVFRIFSNVFDSVADGMPFSHLNHILYPEGLFGNKENCGLLLIRPSIQCMKKLPLPSQPFLVALLISRCEVPWLKVFPLRLVFRLGSEFDCYPCPIVSYRNRKPCFFEIGQTIINILADFRNFRYSLPIISGLTIDLCDKKISVRIPRNRYDNLMKVTAANDFVLPFAGNFCTFADSHLTCIQNGDGHYQTEFISKDKSTPNKVTGASFIVFSGALKTQAIGAVAKCCMVEDGFLVQISANLMKQLKNTTLKNMIDMKIDCIKKEGEQSDDPITSVEIIWTEPDKNFNVGVRSCIDGQSLQGVNSVRMCNSTDYEGNNFVIRWTELFIIDNLAVNKRDDVDIAQLAEFIAQALCSSFTPVLNNLMEINFDKIGLRVSLDVDKVNYEVGCNEKPLPLELMHQLDSALIRSIMDYVVPAISGSLVMELVFFILVK